MSDRCLAVLEELELENEILKKENISLKQVLINMKDENKEYRDKVDRLRVEEKQLSKSELYEKAIDKWGAEAQITMVFEEMAELQKELCKALRGGTNSTNIAEEIADVKIMLEQMEQYFEVETQVEKFKEYKLARLEERLK